MSEIEATENLYYYGCALGMLSMAGVLYRQCKDDACFVCMYVCMYVCVCVQCMETIDFLDLVGARCILVRMSRMYYIIV